MATTNSFTTNPLTVIVDEDTVVTAVYDRITTEFDGECQVDSDCPAGSTCVLEEFVDDENRSQQFQGSGQITVRYVGTCKPPDEPTQWQFGLFTQSRPNDGGDVLVSILDLGNVTPTSSTRPETATGPNGDYTVRTWLVPSEQNFKVRLVGEPRNGFVFDKWEIFYNDRTETITGNSNIVVEIEKNRNVTAVAYFKEEVVTRQPTRFILRLKTEDNVKGLVRADISNNLTGISANIENYEGELGTQYTWTSNDGSITELPITITATPNDGYDFSIWQDNTSESADIRRKSTRNLILKPIVEEGGSTFNRIAATALFQAKDPEICTDPNANNVGQPLPCTFDPPVDDPVLGCTDPDANNYRSDATEDDGTCTYDEWVRCSDRSRNRFPVPVGLREVSDPQNPGGTCWEPISDISLGLRDINFTYQRGDTLPPAQTFTAENRSVGLTYRVNLETNTDYFVIEPSEFILAPRPQEGSVVNYSIRLTQNINTNSDGITPLGDGITEFDLRVTVTEI